MIKKIILVSISIFSVLLSACGQKTPSKTSEKDLMTCGKPTEIQHTSMKFTIDKTEEEWKKILTEEQYRVLRQKGTERAFTGKFYKHKENGIYVCAGCGNELFKSDTKFESGTGWPSYYDMIEGAVILKADYSYGMERTEVMCAKCGGHLGHVFGDGPKPTGLRYCINSVSLDFKKAK